jgi:DNA-binding winged helix-turn-helix (wHTH) protein
VSHRRGRIPAGAACPAALKAGGQSPEAQMNRRVSFADFVLDRDTRELRRGAAAVPLSPKAFRLLEILVEYQPKAIDKAALQHLLWPNTFVVEKNLANLVADIREALGESAEHPRFVRTVPTFGYAFLDLTANVAAERAGSALPPVPQFRVTGWAAGLRWVMGTRCRTRLRRRAVHRLPQRVPTARADQSVRFTRDARGPGQQERHAHWQSPHRRTDPAGRRRCDQRWCDQINVQGDSRPG